MSTAVLILECSCLVAKAKENLFQYYSKTSHTKKMWKQNPVFAFLLHKHGILYLDGQMHAYYKLVSSWITGFPAKYTESMLCFMMTYCYYSVVDILQQLECEEICRIIVFFWATHSSYDWEERLCMCPRTSQSSRLCWLKGAMLTMTAFRRAHSLTILEFISKLQTKLGHYKEIIFHKISQEPK